MIQLKFLDFNDVFDEKTVITNYEAVDSKTKKFNNDGIFSEAIFGKLDNEGIQYSCQCGKIKGKFYLGTKCEICGTEVRFTDPVIKKFGWIFLGDDYYIINANFWNFIIKIISKINLLNIIGFDKKLTKDGLIKDIENVRNPYSNIGLIKFKENFDEILDYFYAISKNKEKEKYYNIIKEHEDLVFINKIPVFPTILRPALMMQDNLIFDEINNFYNIIIHNSNMIKETYNEEKNDLNILPLLSSIQTNNNLIYDKIIESIKGKTGFIRNNMMGSRINFSARNVITPLEAGYKIDDVKIPYLTFSELYKYQIINILSTLKNISLSEANDIWSASITHFDKEIYLIMKEILNKTKCKLKFLLNRNPSINFGSVLLLNIQDIKTDYNDLTTSISNNILNLLGADYDGDCLNIIALMDTEMKHKLKIFNPKLMLISSENGKFNSDLSIDRDQILGIFSVNNM